MHTARQAIQGFNEKTPWTKWDCRTPARGQEVKKSQGERGEQEAGRNEDTEGHREHRVSDKKHTRMYPCCRKLADRHKTHHRTRNDH